MRRLVHFLNRVFLGAAVVPFCGGAYARAHEEGLDRPLPQYLARAWQTDEGLPNDRVRAIAQTPDGYLWVGTSLGVARFDGVEFTCFNHGNTPELKSDLITCLCVAADGSLWIGSEDGGVAKWHEGQFSRLPDKAGLDSANIRSFCQGRDGSVWMATTGGLFQFKDGRERTYTAKDGLPCEYVTAICETSDGSLLVATTNNGLSRLKDAHAEEFDNVGGLHDTRVHSFCLDRENAVWIGCERGLWRAKAEKVQTYTTAQGLSDNLVTAILQDSRSNFWVGTSSGLNRLANGRLYPELINNIMPYDRINTLFEDNGGNVWVGSREGLIRLTVKPFSVLTKRQGLSHNHVTAVLEDHAGRFWVGSWRGGLNEIEHGKTRVYATTNGFPSDLILALCEGADGSIWVGTDRGGGLIRIHDQKITRFTAGDGLIDASIGSLLEDSGSNLWIGTDFGLCRYDGGRFTVEPNGGSVRVRAICESHANELWVGGDAGLIHRRDGVFENLSARGVFPRETVSALYADPDGKTLWVGTTRSGLLRWRDNQLAKFTVEQGLLRDEIMGLIEDQGWVWMTSTRGIFRVRREDLELSTITIPCISYGTDDGLESLVCDSLATPSIWKTSDGLLCFCTTKGLAVMDHQDARARLSPPPVRIEDLKIDRRPISIEGSEKLNIPPNEGEMEFAYTALDLRAPEKCRFRYKLDGADRDWVEAGTRRVAHYNNISPGDYRFEVQACDKDGVWNRDGASVALLSRPHAWQTWWFRASILAAFVSAIWGMARFIMGQKMRQKLALIEMEHSLERERARISRDIHDDLGATLTQITLLSELAQREGSQLPNVGHYTAQISQTARELVQAMDEIVWAVNPRNDRLARTAGYILQHAEKFFAGTPVRCRFDTPDEWPEESLSAETRHHLFLAAKEALNNVARHSGASEVWVKWRLANGDLELCIEDNGRGLGNGNGHGARAVFGNGMTNMKRRMEEIGGGFEATSAPRGGTAVRLKLKLKR